MLLGFRARGLGLCLSRNPSTFSLPSSPRSLLYSPHKSLFSSTTPLGSKGTLDYDFWDEKISSFLETDPPPGDHQKEYDHEQLSSSFEAFFEAQQEEQITLSHYHKVMLSLLKNGLHDDAVSVYYALKESDCEPNMRTFKFLSRAITGPLKQQRLHRFHQEKDPFDSYESLFDRLKMMNEEDLEGWGVEEEGEGGEEGSDGLDKKDCWPEWPKKVCYAKKNDKNKEEKLLPFQ